jgi:predicted hydrolase (HD superfamily)
MFGEDEDDWGVVALLHDFDYERYDTAADHPFRGCEELRRLGYPEEMIDAIAGHAVYLGVPRETRLAKTLFAVDELSGFVAACALVRPTGIHGMTPKSVKKKLKTPAFAAGVNRDEVRQGAEELGVDFDEHITKVIAALEERSGELGLDKGAGG